jgi:hypothetical protein
MHTNCATEADAGLFPQPAKDHLDFKAALILAVFVPICLCPVVWELTSAIVQYLTAYSH